MHVLVTGGCGFIGSHVALHLRETGHKVSVMHDLVRCGSERNIGILARHGISFSYCDVRDFLFVEDMLDLQIQQFQRFRGEVFNLRGGVANTVSLLEATTAMREISSRSAPLT